MTKFLEVVVSFLAKFFRSGEINFSISEVPQFDHYSSTSPLASSRIFSFVSSWCSLNATSNTPR